MARAGNNHQGTLLIIEKDVHTAYLLDYLLGREGYRVVSTTNCHIARELLNRAAPVDIIFLDISFTDEADCGLLSVIRGLPGWKHVPVLLLAEEYTMNTVNTALDAGATDYIMQPFDHRELMAQLQRHVCKASQA